MPILPLLMIIILQFPLLLNSRYDSAPSVSSRQSPKNIHPPKLGFLAPTHGLREEAKRLFHSSVHQLSNRPGPRRLQGRHKIIDEQFPSDESSRTNVIIDIVVVVFRWNDDAALDFRRRRGAIFSASRRCVIRRRYNSNGATVRNCAKCVQRQCRVDANHAETARHQTTAQEGQWVLRLGIEQSESRSLEQ